MIELSLMVKKEKEERKENFEILMEISRNGGKTEIPDTQKQGKIFQNFDQNLRYDLHIHI